MAEIGGWGANIGAPKGLHGVDRADAEAPDNDAGCNKGNQHDQADGKHAAGKQKASLFRDVHEDGESFVEQVD